ncbi:hypothetical protein FD733_17905 [Pantoea sp. Eser]|nr:hypothetical protein [Pantoea sp. Eser]
MNALRKFLPVILLFWCATTTVFAAGMKPETPVLFLDDQTREATINVLNTDTSTALLHSSLQTLPEDKENQLIITPQLSRVDAGKKQQIRVVLKDGIKLDKQRMQRINFVSIPQDDGQKNRARLLVEKFAGNAGDRPAPFYHCPDCGLHGSRHRQRHHHRATG